MKRASCDRDLSVDNCNSIRLINPSTAPTGNDVNNIRPTVKHPSTPRDSSSTKRRKVSIACFECRTHKTKCDGIHPICGSCQKKKLPESACVYSPERGRRGVTNQYVQMLEEKVKKLEFTIRKSQEEPPENTNTLSSPTSTNINANPNMNHSLVYDEAYVNIPSTPQDNMAPKSPHKSYSRGSTDAPLTPPPKRTVSNIHSLMTNSAEEHVAPWTKASSSSLLQLQNNKKTISGDLQHQENPQTAIDGMGTVTGDSSQAKNSSTTSDDQEYFGSSSAGQFMKQIHRVIDKKVSSSVHHSGSGSIFSGSSHQGSPNSTSSLRERREPSCNFSTDLLSAIVLPPRRVADTLLDNYWVYVHSLYPFLHKPSFMSTYEMLWGRSRSNEASSDVKESDALNLYKNENEPLFQCTLNLVFALGCQLSPDANESEREAGSDVFFQRSKKLLHFDVLEVGNIKVVQALLLMGQYLQCTKLPSRCWIVVGLAIRVAQGIGLHLERKNGNESQLSRELRKRLWGGCIVLDRIISMAYGRPFMIPIARDLKLPQVIDDELLVTLPHQVSASQPQGKPSQMAFLVHTIRLYEIMGEILLTLYSERGSFGSSSVNDNCSPSPRSDIDEQNLSSSLNTILKLEVSLEAWKRGLPHSLQHHQNSISMAALEADQEKSRMLLRQCNVLKARYLHVCILLYRPLLVFYFTREESIQSDSSTGIEIIPTDLQNSLLIQSSKKCVMIAQTLIKTISHNTKAQLPAWWYSIFYLYTAATVLLMARLFPKMRELIGEESLLISWNECIGCMNEYQHYSDSAKKCYTYLLDLEKHVWSTTHDQGHSNLSSIQILGTLPQHNNTIQPANGNQSQTIAFSYVPSADNNFGSSNINVSEWDFDLMQDVSWLGRLPVFTDLEYEQHQGSFIGTDLGGFSFL